MVELDLAGRGLDDARVLAAMAEVPREAFVPAALHEQAYADQPLPIGAGQTISQPYIVALMCQALQLGGGERVLEIGTGSGYGAAVLARLAAQVHSVERIAELAADAQQKLAALGVGNVQVHVGDGTLGWPDAAPYDAIVVTAGGPLVPAALKDELAPQGRLVMPVGEQRGWQQLLRLRRRADGGFDSETLADVAFVPLKGAQGWPTS